MNSFFSLNHPGAIHVILQFVLMQNSYSGKELNHSVSSDNLCRIFTVLPLVPLTLPLRGRCRIPAAWGHCLNTQLEASAYNSAVCWQWSEPDFTKHNV